MSSICPGGDAPLLRQGRRAPGHADRRQPAPGDGYAGPGCRAGSPRCRVRRSCSWSFFCTSLVFFGLFLALLWSSLVFGVDLVWWVCLTGDLCRKQVL